MTRHIGKVSLIQGILPAMGVSDVHLTVSWMWIENKTAKIWKIGNNTHGTNTNRIVVLQRLPH